MPVRVATLTASQVEKIAKAKQPGRYAVGGETVQGLYLRIEGNSVAWVLRTKIGDAGRRVEVGLGRYIEGRDTEEQSPLWAIRNDKPEPTEKTLGEARKWADEKRKAIRSGDDLPKLKRAAKIAKAEAVAAEAAAANPPKLPTFSECAAVTIANRTATMKNCKARQQWETTLSSYCKDIWNEAVANIDRAKVLSVLKPEWLSKNETMRRVRMRMEAVFQFAVDEGYRIDNPAELDKLKSGLPVFDREKVSQPALPYWQVGAFVADLRSRESTSALALEFLILTATRTNETIEARWSEIDGLDGSAPVWNIPKERMKAGKPFTVPLSPRAVAILKAQDANRIVGNDFVFPGSKANKPLSNMALLQMIRGMNEPTPIYIDPTLKKPVVVHGMRSCFRDWAGDETSHQRETIEHALAHGLKDKTEAAYRRSDAIAKRRQLMDDWASHCDTVASNVVTLKAAS